MFIVDDDTDIRRIVEVRWRIAGFTVLTAEDGEAGLRLIRAEKPPVVLLDLMMPMMHGFTVCQVIRSDPSLQGTFIIVASAKAYSADIKKAKELGADLYVNKPYDLEALVSTIQEALASKRGAIAVKFWGMRGSIATPGRTTLRYGGNTSCVEVRCGETAMLLDCGTGRVKWSNGKSIQRDRMSLASVAGASSGPAPRRARESMKHLPCWRALCCAHDHMF